MIQRTPKGTYGGIVLSQPLIPTMVASYKLKPIKIRPDVLVKLTISQFSDANKIEFAEGLEQRENKTPLDVGLFVKSFLSKNSVDAQFFFGDMRVPDYGNIFKEYALKNDVSKIVLDEEQEKIEDLEPLKSDVDFYGAENFLINMITI